ncbi:endo-1,4-beta-xylanase [Pedobacter glucosidilyticus]|uniref:endo-1,4-beta-xylanase n=1 Tax=Pedobacter glucosidilyticus TaxID=1122941 RepID=UPI00047C4273|nr:endo-1,4-beta-xylanase [Pedobacter glucosidilyticus]
MKVLSRIIIVLCLFSYGCKKSSIKEEVKTGSSQKMVTTTNETTDSIPEFLKDVDQNVIIGVALNTSYFNDSLYSKRAREEYNSVTAEFQMKMKALNPSKFTWNFVGTNSRIPDSAQLNGNKRIHGHTLIWHAGLPTFVSDVDNLPISSSAKADTLKNIMKRHIFKTITYYSNNYKNGSVPLVKSWDVVNEALRDNGNFRSLPNGNDPGSIWHKYLGDSYLDSAYRFARQAARANRNYGLKLFYNDYGHEWETVKLDSIRSKVLRLRSIKEGGDPLINGIGMQFHLKWNTPIAKVRSAISSMATTGLLVHISELDISLRSANEDTTIFNNLDATTLAARRVVQKDLYYKVARAYQELVPIGQRWGITLWNVGDKDSWLGLKEEATLYNEFYQKKPTYYTFRAALHYPYAVLLNP